MYVYIYIYIFVYVYKYIYICVYIYILHYICIRTLDTRCMTPASIHCYAFAMQTLCVARPSKWLWRCKSHLFLLFWSFHILRQTFWKSSINGISRGIPLSFSSFFWVSRLLGLQPIATEKLWTFRCSSIGASPPAPLTLLWRGNHSPGGCGVLEMDHRLITRFWQKMCLLVFVFLLFDGLFVDVNGIPWQYQLVYRWCHHGIKSSNWGLNPWIHES